MIYLIKSASYNENDNYIDLLKIGYTEGNNRNKRFMAYRMHSPGYYDFEDYRGKEN